MADMTKLRERTSEFVCGMEDGDPLHAPCVRLATDWQAAYDAQAGQIKLLREALEQYARVPNWGRPFDANGNLTNKRCLFMRFEEMHGFELAQETLAATEPKE